MLLGLSFFLLLSLTHQLLLVLGTGEEKEKHRIKKPSVLLCFAELLIFENIVSGI